MEGHYTLQTRQSFVKHLSNPSVPGCQANGSRPEVVKIIRKARHLILIISFSNNNNLNFVLRALRLIQQFYF